MIYDALIAPFTEFEFMRRALAAVIALALGGAPIGVFLMLRRMSLVGDAMAHAILPGAAIGFLLSGLNLFAMTTGGLIAGFTVAILAGVVMMVAGLARYRRTRMQLDEGKFEPAGFVVDMVAILTVLSVAPSCPAAPVSVHRAHDVEGCVRFHHIVWMTTDMSQMCRHIDKSVYRHHAMRDPTGGLHHLLSQTAVVMIRHRQ